MKLGYNTNGTAYHRWQDSLRLMADLGYEVVGITVDNYCLNPFVPTFEAELDEMARLLQSLRLSSVIETGARYLLDPLRKHEPTLITPDPAARRRRLVFLERCVDIAAALGSDAVSFWSGRLHPGVEQKQAWTWLTDGCRRLCEYAAERSVRLAFEPEPGMLVERLAQFERLLERVDAPCFGLTIDVGHVHCLSDGTICEQLRKWHQRLFNVHIEDMRRGVHEHLRFGEGEIDFTSLMRTLVELQYHGPVVVELSRHSHVAPEVMAESIAFLRGVLRRLSGNGPPG